MPCRANQDQGPGVISFLARRPGNKSLIRSLFLIMLTGFFTPVSAGYIAIIIDDIGYSQYFGNAALSLDPHITLSILPQAPFAQQLADKALDNGNEVMLHLPMQAAASNTVHEPDELTLEMTEQQFKSRVMDDLNQFPQITGINNHMGSILTRHNRQMSWLMDVLAEYPGLFFVDSRTHYKTVAAKVALKHSIPTTSRDVFLDSKTSDHPSIAHEFQRLLDRADSNGFALAIGHPHPETIQFLAHHLSAIQSHGHKLIPVSHYIQLQDNQTCPKCSSPSLKVVKNSKP